MSQTLLKVQIGPVQDFIAQARSTRDLWSGSYLLSWLVAHALKTVVDQCRPDDLVFPSRKHQPLLDWLEKPVVPNQSESDRILTPNLPNIFLVVVPEGKSAENLAKRAADELAYLRKTNGEASSEWARICDGCLSFLRQEGAPVEGTAKQRWEAQVVDFWQVTWQTWAILEGDSLNKAIATLPPEVRSTPPGWSANYQLVSHRLDARRQTRDFKAWDSKGFGHKDHFSGKEEVIADALWLEKARKSTTLRHLFRNNDELGGINLIKRVWHRAYLDEKMGLKRARQAFVSVPDVAATPWRGALRSKLLSYSADPNVDTAFGEFTIAVQNAKSRIDPEIAETFPKGQAPSIRDWIEADSAIFNSTTWDAQPDVPEDASLLQAGVALGRLTKAAGLNEPCRYYAVLAFDGDEMGKWLSGAKTDGKVDREFHQSFSGKLSGFALNSVRNLIETSHQGELIYAGGDDVLVLLPATEAVACARALAASFCKIPMNVGRLTASVGLAIGHIKEPLQDMIHEAQAAEKRAKAAPERQAWDRQEGVPKWRLAEGWNRDALAVTLFKRSGETIQWGAKFNSTAFLLLDELRAFYRPPVDDPQKDMPISGKFPHRIAELLGRYQITNALDAGLRDIARKELAWIIQQQTWTDDKAQKERSPFQRARFEQCCATYLDELLAFRWKRKGEPNETAVPRPLRDFINVFLLEAFIARQRE